MDSGERKSLIDSKFEENHLESLKTDADVHQACQEFN